MKSLILLLVVCISFTLHAQQVQLRVDTPSPQASYAASVLSKAMKDKGYSITNTAPFTIHLAVDPALGSEAYTLAVSGKTISIAGGDGRGIIYGSLSLAEDINNNIALTKIKSRSEKPHLPFRAIKYDLPWDTYRHSYSLDQHQETCSDINYWRAFLDMMAANRINTLTLWNLHPYPFLIKPDNFPEASPFTDEELGKWQSLFGGIFSMARERGIDTYIMPFNIFVTPEFSRAHNVAMNNLDHHHFVDGDTSEIVKRYTRECVAQMLREYPDLTGIGLTLGEGMGGMTPQQREDWMKEAIIEGIRLSGRKAKLIHRIPFSSTTGSLGPTSVEMEQITRRGIEQEAALDFIEGPVWADLKFNWSHAHSTPTLVKVHGGKLYGTYFNPVPADYKVTWTARNEDFFCLRWGVPSFVREHIKQNSHDYVGGYFIGSETYIPAKDYFTKDRSTATWMYAFERQWLFYSIWGRLLYNPDTPDEVFRQAFVTRYGKDGSALFEASTLAGTTPLRLASSFDFTWDFTLYSEGFMALNRDTRRVEYISADRLINQPPLDPRYVNVKDYIDALRAGRSLEGKITPPVLIADLERDCNKALQLVRSVNTKGQATLEQEVADIRVWANLGLHFAEKLKGSLALQTYRTKGGEDQKQTAIQHFEKALRFWNDVIAITEPLYQDMPLVHYSEQDGKHWKENDHLRFHWRLIREDVAKDIQLARDAQPKSVN